MAQKIYNGENKNMKQDEIIDTIVDYLSMEDVTTISNHDYTGERTDTMIVVSIQDVKQVNFGLPDYQYEMHVTLDSFITEDENAEKFTSTRNEINRRLNRYFLNQNQLSELFGNIPVVYFNFEDCSERFSETSNVCDWTITIITSF